MLKFPNKDQIEGMKSIMNACQMSIYAGASDGSVRENYEKTKALISALESYQ